MRTIFILLAIANAIAAFTHYAPDEAAVRSLVIAACLALLYAVLRGITIALRKVGLLKN